MHTFWLPAHRVTHRRRVFMSPEGENQFSHHGGGMCKASLCHVPRIISTPGIQWRNTRERERERDVCLVLSVSSASSEGSEFKSHLAGIMGRSDLREKHQDVPCPATVPDNRQCLGRRFGNGGSHLHDSCETPSVKQLL